MCGRFSIVLTEKQIEDQLANTFSGPDEPLEPMYNIAPTDRGLVVLNESPSTLHFLRWGLVPHWAKDSKHAAQLINARKEDIESKPSFRQPIRHQRCVVIADSFYEWKKVGKQRLPYRILPADGSLLLMAGVWDECSLSSGRLRTFSIITTTPNAEMAAIHNRMPVLLHASQWRDWLADQPLDDILGMLHPPSDRFLRMYPVSTAINKAGHQSAAMHEEVIHGPLTLF
ncbi:MAG: SOS response-associated peptidase [Saprospiraceae bacterium]